MNVLRNLGPVEAVALRRCRTSGCASARRRTRTTLEGFIAARFGWRLYRHFFKTYTEKVWGVPATEISADWGAQRIKDLSLVRAVVGGAQAEAARASRDKAKQVTSLIEEFNYPKYGPGHDVGGRDREGRRRAGTQGRVRPRASRSDRARRRRRATRSPRSTATASSTSTRART